MVFVVQKSCKVYETDLLLDLLLLLQSLLQLGLEVTDLSQVLSRLEPERIEFKKTKFGKILKTICVCI